MLIFSTKLSRLDNFLPIPKGKKNYLNLMNIEYQPTKKLKKR